MIRRRVAVSAAVLGAAVLAALPVAPPAGAVLVSGDVAAAPWVRQAGTYDALAAGDFDGSVRVGSLVPAGSIGLGTVDRLDGEVVVMDGRPYRVGIDGRPRPLGAGTETPFLQAVPFRAQASRRVPKGTACSALQSLVDRTAATSSGVVAVRVVGTFSDLVTRSVPAQPAGTTLAQAITTQQVFSLGARAATLVGFRTGPDVVGLSPVGLHLHGLTTPRTNGGHVLSCTVAAAVLQVERTRGVQLVAP